MCNLLLIQDFQSFVQLFQFGLCCFDLALNALLVLGLPTCFRRFVVGLKPAAHPRVVPTQMRHAHGSVRSRLGGTGIAKLNSVPIKSHNSAHVVASVTLGRVHNRTHRKTLQEFNVQMKISTSLCIPLLKKAALALTAVVTACCSIILNFNLFQFNQPLPAVPLALRCGT